MTNDQYWRERAAIVARHQEELRKFDEEYWKSRTKLVGDVLGMPLRVDMNLAPDTVRFVDNRTGVLLEEVKISYE